MATNVADRLRDKISRRRAELAELETALRVVESVMDEGDGGGEANGVAAGHQPSPSAERQRDLAESNIEECCRQILRERSNQPMYYKDLARAALARGYKTGRAASTEKSVIQSFWATMKRKPDVFEPTGKGLFKLVE